MHARDWSDLVANALPFIDRHGLPDLDRIALRGHGDSVTALATNRYIAGAYRVGGVKAPQSLQVFISPDVASRIASAFRYTRKANPLLRFRFTESEVTVSTTDTLANGATGGRMTWPMPAIDPPNADGSGGTVRLFESVWNIIANAATTVDAAQASDVLTGSAAFNPQFVATLAELAKRVGNNEPMRFHVGQSHRGAVIRWRGFVGAIMPVAYNDKHLGSATSALSEWDDMKPRKRRAKPAAEPAAETAAEPEQPTDALADGVRPTDAGGEQ